MRTPYCVRFDVVTDRRGSCRYTQRMRSESSRAVSLAVGGLIALAAAMGIGRFVYTPILPSMLEDMQLTQQQAGFIASANFFGYLLGALAASSASLRGQRRSWFIGALAISGLSTGAMGLTTDLILHVTLRFVGGAASAFVLVFASALILDRLSGLGRPDLSAVHFAGVGVGIAVSALVVAGLNAVEYGWKAQWIVSGAVALFALGTVVWLVPKQPEIHKAAVDSERRRPNRTLVSLIVAYGLFGFGYVITATFLSTIVRESPQLQSVESTVWLVVGLAAIPSVALWTWVGRRWGYPRAFATACLIEGVGVTLSVLVASAAGILLSAVLLGGTFMGITALGLIYGQQLSGGDPRRVLAAMTAAFGLGQVIGPVFAGIGYRVGESFLMPSLVAAATLFLAAALVASTHSHHINIHSRP